MSAQERLDAAKLHGLKFQQEYENVIAALAEIRLLKCVQYGERRYEGVEPTLQRYLCYSDVYRKFIRLETQMKQSGHSNEALLETYSDLANYAIMAVQLLSRK